MHIKIMYNITTFKNVFQMAMYSNAKPQLLLHQPNIVHQLYPTKYKKKK